MFQLIKQVFKSFKHSVILLIGLLFIGFAIIFTSISSVYFSSNIQNSYTSLNSVSNLGTAIVPSSDSDLKTSSLSYDISDNLFKPINSTAKDASGNAIYFNGYKDYADVTKSFAYNPNYLYHSSFVSSIANKGRNIIFAYYVKDSSSNNPYFTGNGINDSNQLFQKRARGVLYSYGEATIPTDSSKWRALGLRLRDDVDMQNVVYEINPLSGETDTSSDLVNTLGYFDDGYYSDYLSVYSGNTYYPTNVTATSVKGIEGDSNTDKIYQYTNNGKATPFFATNWNKSLFTQTLSWDLNQWTISEIISMLGKGVDIFSLLPSLSGRTNDTLSLKEDIDWNLASFTPTYEYMKIIRDKNYLMTHSDDSANSANVGTGANDITQFKDFVFSVHLDESKLTNLEKQTLDYVRKTYGDETYANLVSFVYTVNSSWVKTKLQTYTNDNISSLDSLADLTKTHPSKTESTDGNKTISGADIIKDWIKNYSTSKLTSLKSSMKTYEKEYLASKLNTVNNIEFNNQESFTISDSTNSSTYLVSRKDYNQDTDKYQSNNVNKLVYTSGSRLTNSSKYLDIANQLFDTTKISTGGYITDTTNPNYSINPDGNYLINLVRFIKDSYLQGITNTQTVNSKPSDYDTVVSLASSIIDGYDKNRSLNLNDYYHLFSIVTPDIYKGNLVTTNNQNIVLTFEVKYGIAPSHFQGTATYSTPYGSAAIVTDKWLDANNKTIVNPSEWKEALGMSSSDYVTWLKNLDSSKSFSINSMKFAIIGTGISAENAYPITALTSPLPNTRTESLIYVNDQGYESILSTSSLVTQENYFAVASKGNANYLSEINSAINGLTNEAYYSNDMTNHSNVLTMRIGMPKMLIQYIQLFSIALIVVIVIIGVYLCYLLIKIYIEKNQISLAIVKANGLSTWKIVLSLSTFGFTLSVVSTFIGYLLAFFIQSVFIGIIGNYWFIPISYHLFSVVGLITGALCIYAVFVLFVFIGVRKLFKTPINDILLKETELKINKFLYLIKSSRLDFGVVNKFRISLSSTKLFRLILMSLLCSFGLSFISLGVSIPQKFNTSQTNTSKNINYKYNFDLKTPTEQSGLYKLQNYSDLGVTDDTIGIYNIYQNPAYIGYTDPYAAILNDSSKKDLFALRDIVNGQEQVIPGKYFSNLLLPSYVSQRMLENSPQFFRNAVATKWLLDFQINVTSVSLNIWDYVSSSFSPELVSKINSLSNSFLDSVMNNEYLAKANEEGNGENMPFIAKEDGEWKIQSKNVLTDVNPSDLSSLRFNDNFLKFIGLVYGYGYGTDQSLAAKDAKISFGIIPYENDATGTSTSETYTYLDATFNSPNIKINPSKNGDGYSSLFGFKQEILGIKKNSSFVNLVDSKGNDINDLLYSDVSSGSNSDETVYPIIINNGAAYKYDLSVGQEFSTTISNTYDRYTKKMISDNSVKTVTFKIVGISSDSFGSQFYVSQENANQILGMNFNQGAYIYGTSTKQNSDPYPTKVTIIGDESVLNTYEKNNTNFPLTIVDYKQYLSNYVPFNGVFSKDENPLQLRSLSLYSNSGIWANFQKFNGSDKNFSTYLESTDNKTMMNFVVPYSQESLEALYKAIVNPTLPSSETDIRQEIIDKLATKNIESYLQSIFGDNQYVSISNASFFGILLKTYSSIFDSLVVVENLIIGLILPIIIFTIMIISSTTLNDFKKILLTLKTLGFSDSEILKSIFVTYGIVLVVSFALGFLILSGLLVAFQYMIFNLSSIYLSSFVGTLPYLYGAIAIFSILLLNIFYIALLFKKLNLKNFI